MTVPMTETEARIERETVEAVFSLGGGELDDEPTTYTTPDGEEHVFTYTYDGPPEYASSEELSDLDECNSFTAIGCYIYSSPPAQVTIKGTSYKLRATYSSSGETTCPCDGCDEDPFEDQVCPYCKREPGEEHGCAYLGEGWLEAVYEREVAHPFKGAADWLRTLDSDEASELAAELEDLEDRLNDRGWAANLQRAMEVKS